MGLIWAYYGLTMGLLWAYYGLYYGLTMGLLWAYSGLTMGLLLAYSGLTMGLLWASYGLTVGLLWADYGLTMGLLWAYKKCSVCLRELSETGERGHQEVRSTGDLVTDFFESLLDKSFGGQVRGGSPVYASSDTV